MLRKIRIALVSVFGIPAVLMIAGCATTGYDGQRSKVGMRPVEEPTYHSQMAQPSDSDLILSN